METVICISPIPYEALMEGDNCLYCEKPATWLPVYQCEGAYCDEHWPYGRDEEGE